MLKLKNIFTTSICDDQGDQTCVSLVSLFGSGCCGDDSHRVCVAGAFTPAGDDHDRITGLDEASLHSVDDTKLNPGIHVLCPFGQAW